MDHISFSLLFDIFQNWCLCVSSMFENFGCDFTRSNTQFRINCKNYWKYVCLAWNGLDFRIESYQEHNLFVWFVCNVINVFWWDLFIVKIAIVIGKSQFLWLTQNDNGMTTFMWSLIENESRLFCRDGRWGRGGGEERNVWPIIIRDSVDTVYFMCLLFGLLFWKLRNSLYGHTSQWPKWLCHRHPWNIRRKWNERRDPGVENGKRFRCFLTWLWYLGFGFGFGLNSEFRMSMWFSKFNL